MFTRFTQEPEGQPIYVRTARVLSFAKTSEGTRIWLGGGLNCLVAEDEEAVLAALTNVQLED
jgi:hypothetical protein